MLELWFGTIIAEGILFVVAPLWRFRRVISAIVLASVLIATIWLWKELGLVLGAPFVFLALFRCFNLFRIIKNRMHERYLKQTTARTSLRIFFLHPILLIVLVLPAAFSASSYVKLLTLAQLLVAVGILVTTLRNIMKLSFKMPETFLTDRELPTVTVAIPARNETTDLQECLNTILANDYPKLEIIVLDDCSQGKTAEIIKSFAQDGVRFIQGEAPADRWLAKNQAYQQLYQEASGDLMLYCGVDVRLGPQAIRSMVNLLHSRKKSMLSVLPVRSQSTPADAFIQPMRYWWELALPRRLFNRPPVLSTCWMIGRNNLKKLGSFAAVSHTILPETFFARELIKTDGYSFVRSSNELEVKTAKSFSEQYNTAIRTRYPQIRRRPEWALIMTAVNVLFLVLPFVFLVASVWADSISSLLTGLACMLIVVTHVAIVNITDPANSLLAIVSFPVAAISEMIIGYVSMIQYEFFTVSWKDRNICIPVMHVIPRLPNIEK